MAARGARPPATIVASANGAVALPAAMRILRRGGSALDAVEAAARIVEADPRDTSVGRGGWPNLLGVVEVDASIMDGRTRRAGAVAAVRGYLYPISIARAVMERLPHVLLVGDGAMRFAAEIGAERARLLTASTRRLWTDFLRDAGETPSTVGRKRALAPLVMRTVRLARKGTVNFVALDRRGHMASAVSTSGWGYKYPGRVGDSPLIGAGNYCDERYGGAACTGFGELAMRALTAKSAVDRLAEGQDPLRVARAAIREANAFDADPPPMNVVVLARDGRHASATNRAGRTYAVMTAEMAETRVIRRAVVRTA
ncbi:MAG: isoaspartyl peptidase/L-asparaginase [Candidatus Limnocylindria bacterium]